MKSVNKPRLSMQVLASKSEGLQAMIDHHRALWDEVVVVDTGGGSLARLFPDPGIHVVSYPWDEDFAAARNAGLDAARGDWILILDTDELIATADQPRLRAALPTVPAVMVMTTINYFPDSRHPEWRPVSGRNPREEEGQTGCFHARRAGLFPRQDGLRFHGCIHESVVPSAERLGLPVRDLDIPVHHYGYVQGTDRNKLRRQRDVALVRRKHAADPSSTSAMLELATVLLEDGEGTAAVDMLLGLVEVQPVDSAVTRGRFLLGRILREKGTLDDAAELLDRALADDPRLLFCWLERIRVEADRQAWGAVDGLVARARELFGDDPLLAREDLRCLVKTGRLAAASALVERLQASKRGWPDLAGLAVRLKRALGRSGG